MDSRGLFRDSSGHTVMLHKLDNTQYGSISVAEDKAHTALDFRRPSKVFEDLVAQGGINMRILSLRGAAPLEGGVPILVDGKIIGAIGVSGGASSQEDVELDFAKTAGKRHLLQGRDLLIAEEDDGVIIVGAFDSGERLVVDGSGQVDTADLGADRGARRNNLDRHWRSSCW